MSIRWMRPKYIAATIGKESRGLDEMSRRNPFETFRRQTGDYQISILRKDPSPMARQNNRTVEDVFSLPLLNAIEQSKTRACGKFTDESRILSGALRALEKANSALVSRKQRQWDRSDSRNNGVTSDEIVGSYGSDVMRRVTYCDPVTEKTYCFLTTEMTLPPGLIAFIYKLGWDIDKIYDHIKNDLGESKAWTKSESGKIQQALFITIAYILRVIFERLLKSQEGIADEKSLHPGSPTTRQADGQGESQRQGIQIAGLRLPEGHQKKPSVSAMAKCLACGREALGALYRNPQASYD